MFLMFQIFWVGMLMLKVLILNPKQRIVDVNVDMIEGGVLMSNGEYSIYVDKSRDRAFMSNGKCRHFEIIDTKVT